MRAFKYIQWKLDAINRNRTQSNDVEWFRNMREWKHICLAIDRQHFSIFVWHFWNPSGPVVEPTAYKQPPILYTLTLLIFSLILKIDS